MWNLIHRVPAMNVDVECEDYLKDNSHLYATKAPRKKIALIRIKATNRHTSDVRLLLGSTRLTAGGNSYEVEQPAVVIRKLSEFTWDFLLFAITDMHNPVTAIIEGVVFLGGPLYNRRLRRKLKLLTNDDLLLPTGESRVALLAFRGVRRGLEDLTIPCRSEDGNEQKLLWQFKMS